MYRFTSSLPYLLNRAGVRLGELFNRELEEQGLSLPMYRVLAALSERGDQRLTDLSGMTTIEMTTLSRLSASMQRQGLLQRLRPDDNLRTLQISLTAEGRALAARLMPRAEQYEAVAMRGLGAEQVACVKQALAQIFGNLDALEGSQAPRLGRRA